MNNTTIYIKTIKCIAPVILFTLFGIWAHDQSIWRKRHKQIDQYLELRDIGQISQSVMLVKLDSMCKELKNKQWIFKDESLVKEKTELLCDVPILPVDLGTPDLCHHYQVKVIPRTDSRYYLIEYGCRNNTSLYTEFFTGCNFSRFETDALLLSDTCLLKYLYFKSL